MSVAAVGATTAVLLAFGAAPAVAVSEDAYLEEYDATDGVIEPDQGNRSRIVGGLCTLSWDLQAVTDSQLSSYAVNGFLQSASRLADPTIAGSGHGQLQHFMTGSNLNWRIVIAVDQPLDDVTLTATFDDADWAVDTSFWLHDSTWANAAPPAPQYDSRFHRFTGISGYLPHDDSLAGAPLWGNDGTNDTLTVQLGDMAASTSTVVQFRSTNAQQAFTDGVSMGLRVLYSGTQPMAGCVQHAYEPASVHRGEAAGSTPAHVDLTKSLPLADPAALTGASYALGAGAPAGATINPATGAISWPVPAAAPLGPLDIPTVITFADGSERTADFRVTVLAALPPTGAELPLGLLGVAGMLLLGGLLLARRTA